MDEVLKPSVLIQLAMSITPQLMGWDRLTSALNIKSSLALERSPQMPQIYLHPDLKSRLKLSADQIVEFCQRWQVRELALFGSVLRADFRHDSDIDILIAYSPEANNGLLARVRMKNELETLCGRDIDLMTKKSIEQSPNRLRRYNILDSAQVIYVA